MQRVTEVSHTFEGKCAQILAKRHELKEANTFVHVKDVKMKDLLINKCILCIQERYATNHLAKHLFKPVFA